MNVKVSMLALAVLAATGSTLAGSAWADPGTTVRPVDLKAMPASDAKTVLSLPKDAPVDVVTRQGAWIQLKSGKTTGWAKLFDVRLAPTGGPARASSNSEALNLALGNRGSSLTTGVRGLDADMLEKAAPNPAQFAKLQTFAQTAAEASAFARAGNLKSRDVAPLAPADVAAPATPGAAK
ncbi:MAG: hypothetical protein JSR18_08650 [Proteobacteria bacterium]|nr:hypothetical protein [Pseudomonadota bacterium]